MMQTEAVSFPISDTNMQTRKAISNPAETTSIGIDPSQWVDDHGDYLFRYAIVRLRDETAAEDIVQETLLCAIQAMSSYRGKSTERTWLTGILKHKIIDYFRKSIREVPLGESETDLSGFDQFFQRDDEWTNHWSVKLQPHEWKMTPETIYQENEFFRALDNCMSKLPSRVAGIFTLREMEGLSSDEICRLLSISTSNFGVIMHRARLSLRRCIELNWFRKVY